MTQSLYHTNKNKIPDKSRTEALINKKLRTHGISSCLTKKKKKKEEKYISVASHHSLTVY